MIEGLLSVLFTIHNLIRTPSKVLSLTLTIGRTNISIAAIFHRQALTLAVESNGRLHGTSRVAILHTNLLTLRPMSIVF